MNSAPMSQPTPLVNFSFEGTAVRIVDREGDPWWVLTDVCQVLDLTNPRNVTTRLDDDEKGVCTMDTLGGPQTTTIINESGLYSLILTSRKPEAKRFKRWVTHDVLPQIRKTGAYNAPDPMAMLGDPASMRHLLLTYTERLIAAEDRIKDLAPQAAAYDRLTVADGDTCLTNAAKILEVPPRRFMQRLNAMGWIYRRPGGGSWVAYQDKLKAGHLTHKVTEVTRTDGTTKIVEQVRVTPKGMAALSKTIGGDEGLLVG